MTREIRVRANNYSTDSDCYLAPDDPIHAIKTAEVLNTSAESVQTKMNTALRERAQQDREDSPEMQYARKHNIKPGSVAWNALWGRL